MRDVAARLFAREQGTTFYRSTKVTVLEFVRDQRGLGNHQVKVVGMKKDAVPAADLMVDDVMRRWPSTIRVFPDFRMRRVGCPIATFHAVAEACDERRVNSAAFLSKLRDTVKAAAWSMLQLIGRIRNPVGRPGAAPPVMRWKLPLPEHSAVGLT